jgi:molecular chaperone HtpG
MLLKKISNYITRKVADKLKSLFTETVKILKKMERYLVLEYGMLSEDKFYEKQAFFFTQQLTINYLL